MGRSARHAPETPVSLSAPFELLGGEAALPVIARDAGLPVPVIRRVWLAAGAEDARPVVDLT